MSLSQSLREMQPGLFQQFEQILREGKLSHAYLFSGGYGSLKMALYLAQSRFCQETLSGLPCGECRSCRLIEGGEFADVTIIEPQGQLIKTEQIRSLSQTFAQSGYEANHQVFIIKGAERLHPNAANSLLKQIEEPSIEQTMFLLTDDASQVLPTLRSRSQLFRFVLDRSQLVRRLELNGLLKSQAELLADLAKTEEELDGLINDKRLLDALPLVQRFLKGLLNRQEEVYLVIPSLVVHVPDKVDQERLLTMMVLQASQELPRPEALEVLEKLQEIKRFWQANVSLQNALDYLVLTVMER